MKADLLLLHGALSSKLQFNSLLPLLESKYTVHTLNFSGHGGEPIPLSGYTFDTFANDILTYLDKHNLKAIHLFGYSMGGYAALYFATLHPQCVKSIVTLNTKFNWDPLSTAKETALLNAEKMMEKVPAFANNLMMQHGMNLWKQVLKSTEDMMNKLVEHVQLTDDALNKITTPVTICVGDRDQTASIRENLSVYEKLPNAGFCVLPNTGHPFEKVDLNLLSSLIQKQCID